MDPITLGLAGIAGGLNFAGQVSANRQNVKLAREQMRFQERMSNTSFQRAVTDLQKAGLNPALAYGHGGSGASSPTGSTALVENALQATGQMANLAQVELMRSQARKNDVEANNEATRGGLIDPEFQLRAALAKADIDLKASSAQEIAAKANLARQQLRELTDTWGDRKHLPGLDRIAKQLDNIFATGSLEDRLVAVKLANALSEANIDWASTKGDIGKALGGVFLPWLRKASTGSQQLSDLVDAFSKLPIVNPGEKLQEWRDNFRAKRQKGASWLKKRGLGSGKPRW